MQATRAVDRVLPAQVLCAEGRLQEMRRQKATGLRCCCAGAIDRQLRLR